MSQPTLSINLSFSTATLCLQALQSLGQAAQNASIELQQEANRALSEVQAQEASQPSPTAANASVTAAPASAPAADLLVERRAVVDTAVANPVAPVAPAAAVTSNDPTLVVAMPA
jgi:hypothetical protein